MSDQAQERELEARMTIITPANQMIKLFTLERREHEFLCAVRVCSLFVNPSAVSKCDIQRTYRHILTCSPGLTQLFRRSGVTALKDSPHLEMEDKSTHCPIFVYHSHCSALWMFLKHCYFLLLILYKCSIFTKMYTCLRKVTLIITGRSDGAKNMDLTARKKYI